MKVLVVGGAGYIEGILHLSLALSCQERGKE